MNPFATIDDNNKKSCSGCDKILPIESFIINKKTYQTCNICRAQNKLYKQNTNNEQSFDTLIDIHELIDVISQEFDTVENSVNNKVQSNNKENQDDVTFTFSCSVNINELEGSSKEQASHIIEIISDVDEYKWM
ncbi:14494_t:CDS:1 [Racocetra fulgida]|uniref:14494_t:CDS:1 n=1 Tax=Racocetra fulgida TaxID=60492 RepID=A0A9N9DK80_9GLOM|nr:14494_t:CDS:1 [Racocetra fulgida]